MPEPMTADFEFDLGDIVHFIASLTDQRYRIVERTGTQLIASQHNLPHLFLSYRCTRIGYSEDCALVTFREGTIEPWKEKPDAGTTD